MPFTFTPGPISGLVIIQPRRFPDARGFFEETYKASDFTGAGIEGPFVQDNHSFSGKGALRGIHFQHPPHAQGKLVGVVTGSVWDVAVDLRQDSATYRQWFSLTLTASEGTLFYIPPGFGHGFLTLTDNTHFVYKCTAEYASASDGGIRWDDPDIGISWPIGELGQDCEAVLSDKDRSLPFLQDLPGVRT